MQLCLASAMISFVLVAPAWCELLAAKAAGKAVRKLATRLTSGEKRNRKRMSQVAAIKDSPSRRVSSKERAATSSKNAWSAGALAGA
jgi:hypothetical protein